MRALTLREMLGPEEMALRRYTVKGEIAFVFKPVKEDHAISFLLPSLRQQIALIDQLFPWKEAVAFEDQTEPELRRYLSDGCAITHNFRDPEQHVWFGIVPRHSRLRKSQLYAYERYLEKLAEELAKKELFGAVSVRSVFKTSGFRSFEK